MKRMKWAIGVAVAAMGPAMVAAQTMSAALSGGSPSGVQRWGTKLDLLATVTGTCSTNPTVAGVATFIVQGPTPIQVSGLTYNGAIPCSGGTFAWPAVVSPSWLELGTDWQIFRATAFTTLAPQGSSKVLPLRFDPEFVVPFGALPVTASIADAAPGFAHCDGHAFEIVDRENMRVPPPPPKYRTPYEMFRFTTARCSDAAPALVNVTLPTGFAGTLVYDRRTGGDPAWRVAGEETCVPNGDAWICFPDTNYRKFQRGANTALYGDAAGVQSVVAFWSPQSDVRGYDLQDLWWAGPSESGWGINVAKSGDKLFIAGFIYDANGKPTWFYMPNGQWDLDTMVWYGDLYSPQGARYSAYSASLFHLGAPIGTGSISFSNTEVGHFDYTIKGLSGGKSIGRYTFAPHEEPGKYTGIYWAGDTEQSGWGLSVSHQSNTVFATWYTYGEDLSPTWFFMPAGHQTAPGVFSGELYRATGAAWAGMHYSSDSTKVARVGTMELRFGADKPGTMTAVVNGETVVNPLVKFDF